MRPIPDLRAALMLLTRLPVRGVPSEPAARSAWAWPLVGAGIGAAGGGAMAGAAALGVAPGTAAALGLAATILLTGALHEDGLADVADGFWGGREPERRLAIMRDSRIGAFGVVALTVTLLLRWSLLLAALDTAPVLIPVAAAAASRAALPVLMRLPPARADGLSRHAGRPDGGTTCAALVFGIAPLLPFGLHGVLAAILLGATLWGVARVARAKIGGQTGDVLGAGQQVGEVAVLVALTLG